ncbi:MtN3-like protein, partial [Phytophthora megakarya]
MGSAFIITIKVLTTIAQIAQRLSPVPDLYRVHKQGDTGVMAFMPLVAMLLCNHVWLLYAYIVKNIFPLFSVCVFGDIILSIYIAIYVKYCPDRIYVVKTIVMGTIPFVLKIKLVIKTKSSAAIPVLLSGIMFVNCGLWLINGIIDNDLFIIVPNIAGVSLTAVQLTLYYIYRPSKHTSVVDT